MKINPLNLIDFYKADHRKQYPKGTITVYSNFTPRQSRVKGNDHIIFFGLQYFIKEYLINHFAEGFFKLPKYKVLRAYKRRMDNALGPDAINVDHIAELHDLGYLPIRIKALPEGSKVPIGVPVLTIKNTSTRFFWLTNYLESLLSCILWKPTTSATTAWLYKKEFMRHAELTGSPKDFVPFQGHDFSFRGMSGIEDAVLSGSGHATSFVGSDTVHAIDFLEEYYNAYSEAELILCSVPATEHSVMSMGQKENELDTFRRLITETYPKGIVSIVSDTWSFWKVVTEYLPALKPEIEAREGLGPAPGRLVVRPDSGRPVNIICGYKVKEIHGEEEFKHLAPLDRFIDSGYDAIRFSNGVVYSVYDLDTPLTKAEVKGAYQCFWDIFGGTVNEKGYKVLASCIGLIYGDSITLDRQKEILTRLEAKGFTASNLVLGIGLIKQRPLQKVISVEKLL